MKKRAEESSPEQLIVYTVLILIALFIIILFLGQARLKQIDFQQVDECRKSIELQAQSKLKGVTINFEQQGTEGLHCPTIIQKITASDGQVIMKQLADQMAYCWYKFGEGNKDLFAPLQDDKRNYCAVCTLVSFQSSASKKKIPNFVHFLGQQSVPIILGKKKYSEYITKVQTNPELSQDAKNINMQGSDIIDTDNNYAVILLYSKQGYEQRIWKALNGAKDALGLSTETGVARTLLIKSATLKGTVGLAIIGTVGSAVYGYATGNEKAADWSAAVVLWPYDETALATLGCDELPVSQNTKELSETVKK